VWGVVLLGLGIGGFFDGIVLHQILQWHHMFTASVPPTTLGNLQLNTVGDGLFHAATYLSTIAGVLLVWSAVRASPFRPSNGLLVGGLLVGWGTFNLVEGIVDHHLLGIHHVRSGPNELLYDLGFLAWGAAMLLTGLVLLRSGDRKTASETAHRVHASPTPSVLPSDE
jgi:uncharacterized membrane protein